MAALSVSAAVNTAFTYQGWVQDAGSPASGLYDFRFEVYNAPEDGDALGLPSDCEGVSVSNGVFTVLVDPGPEVFRGKACWLQIRMGTNGAGTLVTLTPRQPLTATPHALMAYAAADLLRALPPERLSGSYPSVVALGNPDNSFAGNGAGLTSLNAGQLASGTVPDARLAGNLARTNQVWLLGGNTGTLTGSQFLGTTDNQPLELKANGISAFRLEPLGSTGINVVAGMANSIQTNSRNSVISGGTSNLIGSNVPYCVIAGGYGNRIQPQNSYSIWGNTIGGGIHNTIETITSGSTIAGGLMGGIGPRSLAATIGGGNFNAIEGYAHYATIAGGTGNRIQTNSTYAAIGGGWGNQVGSNTLCAAIPGGCYNEASGDYSFAAGNSAHALHDGALVWADSTQAPIASTNANSVTMRAGGGYRLFSNTNATVGASLASGSGSWTSMSDRNAKEAFQPVNPSEVLAKVVALPLTTWKYKAQDASVRHIGPMAQDFKAAFAVGESDTGISAIDADGVALAAIQGLHQKLETQSQKLAAARAENAELKQRLDQLEQLVRQLALNP